MTIKTLADVRRGEIRLTRRDLKVLATLEKWGVLGIGQAVGLDCEGTPSKTTQIERFFNHMERADYKLGMPRRLHLLEEQGYIQGHFFLRQPKAFTLTERGFNALRDERQEYRPEVRDFVSEAIIRHELKVTGVGLVLAEVLGLAVRRQHPQAVWVHTGGRRRLIVEGAADLLIDSPEPKAIEVELTQKSKRRYEDIFESYRRRLTHGGVVLYLTGWPGGAAIILKNARAQRAPFVYACGLDEFRRSAGRCAFQGAVESRTIILDAAGAAEAAR